MSFGPIGSGRGRDLDMSDVIADGERMRDELAERFVAWDRPETDPCERLTVGCSVNHAEQLRQLGDSGECETW